MKQNMTNTFDLRIERVEGKMHSLYRFKVDKLDLKEICSNIWDFPICDFMVNKMYLLLFLT